MSYKLEAFEQHLKDLLNDTFPVPKYDLWQKVIIPNPSRSATSKQPETEQGQIVGYYFSSVGISYLDSTRPGWFYYVQVYLEHQIIHENQIQLAKESSEALRE